LIQLGLYRRVVTMADDLCLSQLERLLVRKEQLESLVLAISGLLVAMIALVFMSSLGYLAGIAYSVIPIAIPLVTLRTRRKIRSLLCGVGDEKH
jgi:hypothetical protein